MSLTFPLGCFPLDLEPYRPKSVCDFHCHGPSWVFFSLETPSALHFHTIRFSRATFIAFAEYQLSPSSFGISPLYTDLPKLLRQLRVRSSFTFLGRSQTVHA